METLCRLQNHITENVQLYEIHNILKLSLLQDVYLETIIAAPHFSIAIFYFKHALKIQIKAKSVLLLVIRQLALGYLNSYLLIMAADKVF